MLLASCQKQESKPDPAAQKAEAAPVRVETAPIAARPFGVRSPDGHALAVDLHIDLPGRRPAARRDVQCAIAFPLCGSC